MQGFGACRRVYATGSSWSVGPTAKAAEAAEKKEDTATMKTVESVLADFRAALAAHESSWT